jgi:hypothetical protein
MPQMDVDIRKPVTHSFGIQRPGKPGTATTSSDDDIDDSDDEDEESGETSEDISVDPSDERVHQLQEARDQLETRDLEQRADYPGGNSLDIEEQMASQPLSEAYPLYDSDDEDEAADALEEARRIGGWTYYSKLLSHTAHKAGSQVASALRKITPAPKPTPMPRTNGILNPFRSGEIRTKHFKAPKGKKIHVPVRVEPKVYFAAERTFLAWVRLPCPVIPYFLFGEIYRLT